MINVTIWRHNDWINKWEGRGTWEGRTQSCKRMEQGQGNCPNMKGREGVAKRGMMLGWTNRSDRKITKEKAVKKICKS
jgi:hypothetical protein